jgi:transposase
VASSRLCAVVGNTGGQKLLRIAGDSPATAIREGRRLLRYRRLVIKQAVQMKSRVSGLLMETGASYNKLRLHKVGYFGELMSNSEEISDAVRPLLNLSRGMIRRAGKLEYDPVSWLERDPLLKERLRRLRTVHGVGSITALTWALEIGDYMRFPSNKQAISYCGLCTKGKTSGSCQAQAARSRRLVTERRRFTPEALFELFRDWR